MEPAIPARKGFQETGILFYSVFCIFMAFDFWYEFVIFFFNLISCDSVMGFLVMKRWEGNHFGSVRSFCCSVFQVFSIELFDIEIVQ